MALLSRRFGTVVHVWLLLVKYCCGVVLDYNSDIFSGSQKATNCKKQDMKRINPMPERNAAPAAARLQARRSTPRLAVQLSNPASMIGGFLS
ncbi:hypothetical protein [Massilia sp. GCM10023247]|uniref:hypothetical protein n=1 Tax=Massilia sp. GCM10023247 TaxID=3252643 RepID=UPI00360CB164